jgi:hypothetical protein
LLKAKQLPSLPSRPPLTQTTQANSFFEKAWMQETSCWQRQACQKQKSFWVGFSILGNYKISLPKNKFITWTTNINKLIVKGMTTTKELELTIGQLGHLALVVPGVHHFLSRLLELKQLATHCHSI